MSEKELAPSLNQPQMTEYHRLEIEEIFTGIREVTNMRAQMFSFLGIADLTALGFAFGTRYSILFLVAAVILLIAVIADTFLRRREGVLYFRGLQLERKYSSQEPSLLSTYIAVAAGERFLASLAAVTNLKDQRARVQALKRTRSSIFGFWLPIAIAFIESITGILFWLQMGWSLF